MIWQRVFPDLVAIKTYPFCEAGRGIAEGGCGERGRVDDEDGVDGWVLDGGCMGEGEEDEGS